MVSRERGTRRRAVVGPWVSTVGYWHRACEVVTRADGTEHGKRSGS